MTTIEADLPTRYDPKASEPKWQKRWTEDETYVHAPGADSYTIDTPPPTFSGNMHIGHAYSYAQQDFYARYMRMMTGGKVFFPFGVDDNGLPTERLIEKLKKVRATSMPRHEFIKLCSETVNEMRPEFANDWKRMGISCDFEHAYATIDSNSRATSQRSFIDLYTKGRVYRLESPVSWCVQCQTAIAQAEFENVDLQSHFNDINFSIDGEPVMIATTRPELIPACVALAAHPDDKRYAKYKGKRVTVPLMDYEVPLIFDDKVDLEKGTGLMMVCTFGDKDDVDKWFRHKLETRVIFTPYGKLNDLAGKYAGLSIKDARKAIIEDLKTAGLLVNQKPITHPVNVHERCGTELEFLKTPQWYIKVLDLKEELLAAGEEIQWHPAFMQVRYKHWVENLNWDWCVSRQRFFGVPFPIWYDKDGNVYLADEDQLPVDPFIDRPRSAPADLELTPETDVMDTWATSSSTPQIVLGWHKDPASAQRLLPMSMRPQAHEIIRTWAFYTIVKAKLNNESLPWKNIVLSGFVTDPHGQKMSKSKGNVVDPRVMLEKYSADAIRFWAAGTKLGEDIPFAEKDLQNGNKTITKLWNASRFSLMNLADYDSEWTGRFDELEIMDRWILGRLNRVVKEYHEAFSSYEHSRAKMALEQFFWSDFCDNYMEISKGRIYDPKDVMQKRSAQYALERVLSAMLRLFAPLMPFVTEEIYALRFADGKSVHLSPLPQFREDWSDEQAEIVGAQVVRIIEIVRKHKSTNKLAMNAPLQKLIVTTNVDLTLAENDLLSVVKAQGFERADGDFDVKIE